MNLALFDFDGTITFKDSFQPFLLYAAGRARKIVGTIVLLPLLVGYKFGIIAASKTRAIVSAFAFRGRRLEEITRLGTAYARNVLPLTVRAKALDRIQWHKARGDRVIVVSAALCVYLREWCRQMDIEVICTELETTDGKITGRYPLMKTAERAEGVAKHGYGTIIRMVRAVYFAECIRSILMVDVRLRVTRRVKAGTCCCAETS